MQNSRNQYHLNLKKNRLLTFVGMLIIFATLVAAVFFSIRWYQDHKINVPSLASVYTSWQEKNYLDVYTKTGEILQKHPIDGEVLALRGFSAYYFFVEQTDLSVGYLYLQDSISSLRKALLRLPDSEKPKVYYVLGKAYYQQGYYYADLALKYLNLADQAGFVASDLSEFRGMTARLLNDHTTAISAFSGALDHQTSDLLLCALAESYTEIGDTQNAKLYFHEAIEKTNDILLELKCRYLLGSIFLHEGNIEKAKNEFLLILEKDENFADAHYGMGLVYEAENDIIKARSEWRQAIRINPLHSDTRKKLRL